MRSYYDITVQIQSSVVVITKWSFEVRSLEVELVMIITWLNFEQPNFEQPNLGMTTTELR